MTDDDVKLWVKMVKFPADVHAFFYEILTDNGAKFRTMVVLILADVGAIFASFGANFLPTMTRNFKRRSS